MFFFFFLFYGFVVCLIYCLLISSFLYKSEFMFYFKVLTKRLSAEIDDKIYVCRLSKKLVQAV